MSTNDFFELFQELLFNRYLSGRINTTWNKPTNKLDKITFNFYDRFSIWISRYKAPAVIPEIHYLFNISYNTSWIYEGNIIFSYIQDEKLKVTDIMAKCLMKTFIQAPLLKYKNDDKIKQFCTLLNLSGCE